MEDGVDIRKSWRWRRAVRFCFVSANVVSRQPSLYEIVPLSVQLQIRKELTGPYLSPINNWLLRDLGTGTVIVFS